MENPGLTVGVSDELGSVALAVCAFTARADGYA